MSEIVNAITPQEIKRGVGLNIPNFVVKAVNKLLAKECGGINTTRVTLKKDDVVNEIISSMSGSITLTKEEVINNKWLNFEALYKEAGWNVSFDKPGIGENFDAHFVFSAK